MIPPPPTLVGTRIQLEPLDLERHFAGLVAAVLDPDLWTHSFVRCENEADLRAWFVTSLEEQARGTTRSFIIVDKASGEIAGCTRFSNIDTANRSLEIGWTRVARKFQRTYVNTEAKYSLFKHAFESMGCARVELKTLGTNQRSQNAMVRLGCVEEGVHRKRVLMHDGTWRDVVYYSVLDTEWPAVKNRLEAMMTAPREIVRSR